MNGNNLGNVLGPAPRISPLPGIATWLAVAYSGYLSVGAPWQALFGVGVAAFGLVMMLDLWHRLSAPSVAIVWPPAPLPAFGRMAFI